MGRGDRRIINLQSHRILHKYLLNDPQRQQVAMPIHDDR